MRPFEPKTRAFGLRAHALEPNLRSFATEVSEFALKDGALGMNPGVRTFHDARTAGIAPVPINSPYLRVAQAAKEHVPGNGRHHALRGTTDTMQLPQRRQFRTTQ